MTYAPTNYLNRDTTKPIGLKFQPGLDKDISGMPKPGVPVKKLDELRTPHIKIQGVNMYSMSELRQYLQGMTPDEIKSLAKTLPTPYKRAFDIYATTQGEMKASQMWEDHAHYEIFSHDWGGDCGGQ